MFAEHPELVQAAQRDGGPARAEFIEAYRPLVAALARSYRRHGAVDHDELMQQGVLGLLKALKRYDSSLGTPFCAYAGWWVRHAMQELVTELSGPVVLSGRARRELARLSVARQSYVLQHRREPTRGQLATAAELDPSHVDSLLAASWQAQTLDEPRHDGDGVDRFGDMLADPSAEEAFDLVPRRDAATELLALLARLSERERFIVRSHFGLDGEERTLREIGERLDLSVERVRQIELRALETLRAAASGAAPAPRARRRRSAPAWRTRARSSALALARR